MFKPEHLLFAAEVFLDTPSGKVKSCHLYHVFLGFDFLICGKHHRVFRNAINKDQINVFPGSSDPHFYMGKKSFVLLSFVKQRQFYFSLPAATQFCGISPFVVVQKFPFGGKADDIILFQLLQLKKHLVIVIPPVHNKGGFSKQCFGTFHGRKGHMVEGSEPFFSGRVDFRKDAGRMAVTGKNGGLCYIVAFFMNIFCGRTFGTVTHPAEGFKFVTVRLYDIAVIDMDDRLVRTPFFNLNQGRNESLLWYSFCQIAGKTVYGINFFGGFQQAVSNVREQAAVRNKHTVNHVSSKFSIRSGKSFRDFV